jgi:hypothetical protein
LARRRLRETSAAVQLLIVDIFDVAAAIRFVKMESFAD